MPAGHPQRPYGLVSPYVLGRIDTLQWAEQGFLLAEQYLRPHYWNRLRRAAGPAAKLMSDALAFYDRLPLEPPRNEPRVMSVLTKRFGPPNGWGWVSNLVGLFEGLQRAGFEPEAVIEYWDKAYEGVLTLADSDAFRSIPERYRLPGVVARNHWMCSKDRENILAVISILKSVDSPGS
jgi:hypothetical protein